MMGQVFTNNNPSPFSPGNQFNQNPQNPQNPTSQNGYNGNNPNQNVAYQLIGGMQGLMKPNQQGNPYS